MKVLFLGLPLHGHTNPTLPLVRALVDRGEAVVYYSTGPFAAKIEAAGARFRPYRNAFLADLSQLPRRTDELSWLLMRTTAEILTDALDAFRSEQPDYVIADSVAPWGQWVAQILDVPVVTSVTTFAINRHVLARAFAGGTRPKSARLVLSKIRHVAKASLLGRRLRREYGVKGIGITRLVFGRSDLNIVYTSRLFQPCAESFDESFQFVGPSIDRRTEGIKDEAVGSPLIYVSLGTLFNDDPVFYRHCFEAFRHESVRVLMSIGTAIPEASLGTPPANVIVERHVPQLEVLRRASVFVSHGGMNSVSESLACGVPLVVVPQMGEQAMVGMQVEALGAGLRLSKEEATAVRLREAVGRVLSDHAFRQQATRVRQSFDEAGGASRAAHVILAFTRSRTTRATRPADD